MGHAGILIAESMRVTVEHNTCVEKRTGVEVRQQGIRELPAESPGQPNLPYYFGAPERKFDLDLS